jgi:DNA-binding IclR family transcriptional regulator
MAMTTGESQYRERNSTADRALALFDLFSDERTVISATAVAAHLGVARSSAYRYLQSMVASRFLEEADVGGFRLGTRVLELARLMRRGDVLPELARPRMRALSHLFDQTVLLTRRAGAAIICIEREEPPAQLLRISYERGSRLPINAGASALALLVGLSDVELHQLFAAQPLERYTEHTLTDVGLLIERVREIERNGISVTLAEVDPEAIGIAAPIYNRDGRAAAALSVVAMQSRVAPAQRDEIVSALRETADGIGGALVN